MDNHTELENKLFGYIRFLIGLLNTQEQFLNYLYSAFRKGAEFTQSALDAQGHTSNMQKMIDDLNAEFNWDARITSELPKEDQDASVGTD